MEYKQEGDKTIPIMQDGTIEAYQKAIALDPAGPYAAQAKDGLEALQAMGVGISNKVNQRPANNNNVKPPAKKIGPAVPPGRLPHRTTYGPREARFAGLFF